MSDGLKISTLSSDTRSKAIDLINKYRYKQQQNNAVAANWSPNLQANLMGALNGTNDAACGRTK